MVQSDLLLTTILHWNLNTDGIMRSDTTCISNNLLEIVIRQPPTSVRKFDYKSLNNPYSSFNNP